MPIIARLMSLYESRGVRIASGLNPTHLGGFPLAPYTWFFKDGQSMTEGLGIALQEIYFLECLFQRYRPRHLFAIGNSLGWSTLALALLNPGSRVLAIDAGSDRNARDGIALTNRIAEEEVLSARVVEGRSPEDVAGALQTAQLTPVDFVFVDGDHTVGQAPLDFAAVKPHAAPGCVYLFHDVTTFGLHDDIDRIARDHGFVGQRLPGTTSGMAIVYDPRHRPPALDDIAPFAVAPELVGLVEHAAAEQRLRHRRRHIDRWRRSLAKRRARALAALSPSGRDC